MSILIPIETQPIFPLLDLTEDNAENLKQMLANKMELDRNHGAFEELGGLAFRMAHPAIVNGASRSYEAGHVQAISHGITVFEAIAGYVVSEIGHDSNELALVYEADILIKHATESAMRSEAIEKAEQFTDEMPNTAEVIIASSRKFFGGLTHYAVLGAALERQFQISTLPDLMANFRNPK